MFNIAGVTSIIREIADALVGIDRSLNRIVEMLEEAKNRPEAPRCGDHDCG